MRRKNLLNSQKVHKNGLNRTKKLRKFKEFVREYGDIDGKEDSKKTPSNLNYLFQNTQKSVKDGKVEVLEEMVIDGPRGLKINFYNYHILLFIKIKMKLYGMM